MNYKQLVKDEVEKYGFIFVDRFGNGSIRRVRQVLSELRKEGFVTIPMNNNWCYFHKDKVDQETLNRYYHAQLQHWKTQYFNTILPIAKEVKDEKLQALMGELWTT